MRFFAVVLFGALLVAPAAQADWAKQKLREGNVPTQVEESDVPRLFNDGEEDRRILEEIKGPYMDNNEEEILEEQKSLND